MRRRESSTLPVLASAALLVLGVGACSEDPTAGGDRPVGGCVSHEASDFRGQDLSGRDFTCDSLAGVDFTGADLTGADLTGASTAGATFDDVTWSDTTCVDGTNSDDHGGTCEGHLGAADRD